MKRKHYIKLFYFSAIVSLFMSCTERYELTEKNFESLLVVEATLIDQLGPQKIQLSRTIPLNSEQPIYVNDAQVWVEDGNQNIYTFSNFGMGNYMSNSNFQTFEGETYILHIAAADGLNYVSSPEIAPPVSEIQNLSAELLTVNGEQGVQVLVNSAAGEATFFKYDYEETYKVIAPYYNNFDFTIENVVGSGDSLEYDIVLQPKDENVRVCYSTKNSTAIIQASLNELEVSSIVDFPVRFIKQENAILRERYSILVKQYVQSFEAYNFYRVLKELGITENLLVENQPGFVQGNITCVENPEQSVVGFFQVSSVSSSRLYFNYSDFNIQKPPYFSECEFLTDLDYIDNTTEDFDRNDRSYMYSIFSVAEPEFLYLGGQHPIFNFVRAECGDCTRISSTVIPEFWED
ncbi:DUF4249 domain-containing protein [Winogradskyella schleiferi]|uniref:DUF4249 domain-containing protein n=1 Tax=Winogradskyella schleiferi TaxID=2686078 RepID=UPI0015BEBCBB|nr:DUF4249 domain-containing protein [Winogradskyella schleiferi]